MNRDLKKTCGYYNTGFCLADSGAAGCYGYMRGDPVW